MADRRKTAGKKQSAASGRAGTSSRSSLNGKRRSAARTGKSSGSGRAAASRKTTARQTMKTMPQPNPAMNIEIFCWILLAVSVLIFISLFGIGGKIGNVLGGIFFGLMGTNAYVFPFLLFFLTLYVMANRGSRRAYVQTASAAGLFVTVCGLLELMLVGWRESHSLNEYYEVGMQYHQGGGLIGGALENLFCPTIGVAGTYIVLIAATILFLALITQKTLFVSAGKWGRQTLDEQREVLAARREAERARRQEERAERRAEAIRLREEEKKRFGEQSALKAAPEGSGEDPDGLSISFFVRQKAEGSRSSAEDAQKDLFGDVRYADKKGKKDFVVFGKLSGDVPDGRNAPVTSFEKDDLKAKTVSSGALFRRSRKADAHQQAEASDAHDAAESVSGLEEPELGAGTLSPDLVIHRGGEEASPVNGAGSRMLQEKLKLDSRRASQTSASGKEAADFGRLTDEEHDQAERGEVVTKKKIEEAGASNIRRKAAQQAGAQVSKKVSALEAEQAADNVAREIESKEEEEQPYAFPPVDLLERPRRSADSLTDADLRETASKLQQILATFGVHAKVTNVSCGPSVTRYELQPEMGTKVSKITNLADDIKMNLAVTDIRIEAPIPGKAAVGIEVPNRMPSMVYLRELIDSEEFRKAKSRLTYVVGKDIAGKIVVSDIAKMPHLLIAGATGSGKSVFINTMIMSILYKSDPSDVKLIMIDPKVVELSVYNGIPHLFIPVVTDPKKAAGALNWAVSEMTKRYQMFAEVGVRNLAGYNAKAETLQKAGTAGAPKKLPQIVIIVDELADLMMVSGNEVEDAICRLAQLARACGIHLVIATQRPSVDVITGLIKANIPSRIAFAVSSGTDSRTILDRGGAERLLGNGDMLFSPQNYKNPVRIQGAYVSDEEIQEVVDAIKVDGNPDQIKERMEEVQKAAVSAEPGGGGDVDELFAEAGRFIISKDKASIGMLQRWLKIGFNRAARIMDQLSDAEVVGPDEGTKPRKVLMSEEQFENYLETH